MPQCRGPKTSFKRWWAAIKEAERCCRSWTLLLWTGFKCHDGRVGGDGKEPNISKHRWRLRGETNDRWIQRKINEKNNVQHDSINSTALWREGGQGEFCLPEGGPENTASCCCILDVCFIVFRAHRDKQHTSLCVWWLCVWQLRKSGGWDRKQNSPSDLTNSL